MNQERIHTIRQDASLDTRCVVYVMSRDQRVNDNHALLAAQNEAIRLRLPVVVVFHLLASSGVRAYEHFAFMLEGLSQVARTLASYNIPFIMTHGDPQHELIALCKQLKPAALYFDFSPLHGPRALPVVMAQYVSQVHVVDTHNIVPVWVASTKQEFAAHTFRRKIHLLLPHYLMEPEPLQIQAVTALPQLGIDFATARQKISQLPKRGMVHGFTAGEEAAVQQLRQFISKRLPGYGVDRNDPTREGQSELSPHLHFGQLSSLRVALTVQRIVGERPLLFEEAKMPPSGDQSPAAAGMNALFEEMIVRKELADNFCYYSDGYLSLHDAPTWAQQTLQKHAGDQREFLYTQDQLVQAKTHDEVWNAAQQQLIITGKMHGYMRMYWAKKILEWTPSPEAALKIAQYINDAYSLDGGDPNGYVGVLWSIAGLHDRPWTERPIFGKIRYMNAAGLRRKFAIERYIKTWTKQTARS